MNLSAPTTAAQPDIRPVLLGIHASAATGRSLLRLAAPLGEAFDIVLPNRLGYGCGAPWPGGRPAPFDAEVWQLAHHLRLRADGAHILAHSYGGAVALELALRWPQLVRSLTLYEPGRFALLFDDPATEVERDEIIDIGRTVQLLSGSGRQRRAASLFVDYWSGSGSWGKLEERQRMAIEADMPKVAAEFETAFADRVPKAAFTRQLKMPVRLLCGGASPAPVRRIVQTLAELLPQAEVVTIDGLGHMGPVTHPAAVADQLPEWLAAAALATAA